MLRLKNLFFVLPLTALLGGCGPEDMLDEQSGEGTEPQSALETITQELPYNNGGSWAAGALATPLGSTSNRVCFLIRIQGTFNSGADSVHVFTSGGSWYIGGSGAGTGASAGCADRLSTTSISGEYSWTAGQALPTNLGSTTGRVCYLTRVGGAFNSGADWVYVYPSGGSWFLFGNSQSGGGYARARCISESSYNGGYAWGQSQGYPTHMGATSGRSCALTRMAGQFDSWSEMIRIYSNSGSWYLSGASAHTGVGTRAYCF